MRIIFLLFLFLLPLVSALPDLIVRDIEFSDETPIQTQNITVNTTIGNIGDAQAINVLIKFLIENVSGQNFTHTIDAGANVTVNSSFLATLGPTLVTIDVDVLDTIAEDDETNNNRTENVTTPGYAYFYGNVSIQKKLGLNDLVFDNFGDAPALNIYATDADSNVDFASLQSLGLVTDNTSSFEDFRELDTMLGMGFMNDSIEREFAIDASTANEVKDMNVFDKLIKDVPVVYSTNDSAFLTGILWDYSDDTDLEYDAIEQEDIVFFTQLNMSHASKFGTVDYELRIPATLNSYTGGGTTVSFYIEAD